MGIEQEGGYIPEVLPKPKLEYEGKTALVIQDLLTEGALTAKPSSRWSFEKGNEEWKSYTIDVPKAVAVLEGSAKEEELPQDIHGEYEQEHLEERSQKIFRQIVKSFVERGIVPRPLAVEVGRLLRPSSVEIIKERYHRFLYLRDVFPSTPPERAKLQISPNLTVQREKPLRERLKQAGIDLTAEQIEQINLRWGISHEYGHAVHRTLVLSRVEQEAERQGDKDFQQVAYGVENQFDVDVFNRIALDEELARALKNEPEGGFHHWSRRATTPERVATGFEYLGLRYALEDLGVGGQKAREVVEGFMEEDRKWFREYVQLMEDVRSKGWNLEDLSDALSELRGALREIRREDLLDELPSFGARNFGYLSPLNEKQIKELVRRG